MTEVLSLYIPLVFANMATEETAKLVFEKQKKYGKISHVDFVLKQDGINYSAYVHFEEWERDYDTEYFMKYVEDGFPQQVIFDYNYKKMYWVCLKNKSAKKMTPAVRIDISGLMPVSAWVSKEDAKFEESEFEEEDESDYEDELWMDGLLADEEEENEAWEFMMEELAKEDELEAFIQADYVRKLEEEIEALRVQDGWHAQNAWNAQHMWSQERMYLQSVIAYLQAENIRMLSNNL